MKKRGATAFLQKGLAENPKTLCRKQASSIQRGSTSRAAPRQIGQTGKCCALYIFRRRALIPSDFTTHGVCFFWIRAKNVRPARQWRVEFEEFQNTRSGSNARNSHEIRTRHSSRPLRSVKKAGKAESQRAKKKQKPGNADKCSPGEKRKQRHYMAPASVLSSQKILFQNAVGLRQHIVIVLRRNRPVTQDEKGLIKQLAVCTPQADNLFFTSF